MSCGSAPTSVAPGDPLARAQELMTAFGVRELPVVDRGRVVGIVTRSDLGPHHGYLEIRPVHIAMTANPTTVQPTAPVSDVSDTLVKGHFSAVPVVADGELTGMVGREDLVRLLVVGRDGGA
jgi:CBS domain-containing protein